jgi:hypothetical protein
MQFEKCVFRDTLLTDSFRGSEELATCAVGSGFIQRHMTSGF